MNEYDQAWEDIESLINDQSNIIASYTNVAPQIARQKLNELVWVKTHVTVLNQPLRTRLTLAWRIIRGH